jgi:hypothetical protein
MRPDRMKEPLSKAIERWETEGGASPSGPQGLVRLSPKEDATFPGDFLENPGFAGEMHFSYESDLPTPLVPALSHF